MKAHIGVDSQTKLIHSVVATAANGHDSTLIGELPQGKATRVWGDSAYTGKREAILACALLAKDFTNQKGHRYHPLTDEERAKHRTTSRVRASVEHAFGVMKRRFGFTQVRYRGLTKNAHHLFVAGALTNRVMAKKPLLRWCIRPLSPSCA